MKRILIEQSMTFLLASIYLGLWHLNPTYFVVAVAWIVSWNNVRIVRMGS